MKKPWIYWEFYNQFIIIVNKQHLYIPPGKKVHACMEKKYSTVETNQCSRNERLSNLNNVQNGKKEINLMHD